jgi:hypothetical protein
MESFHVMPRASELLSVAPNLEKDGGFGDDRVYSASSPLADSEIPCSVSVHIAAVVRGESPAPFRLLLLPPTAISVAVPDPLPVASPIATPIVLWGADGYCPRITGSGGCLGGFRRPKSDSGEEYRTKQYQASCAIHGCVLSPIRGEYLSRSSSSSNWNRPHGPLGGAYFPTQRVWPCGRHHGATLT